MNTEMTYYTSSVTKICYRVVVILYFFDSAALHIVDIPGTNAHIKTNESFISKKAKFCRQEISQNVSCYSSCIL